MFPNVDNMTRTSSADFSEEGIMETSTAPTTPDGSLTFSPVLHPTQLMDAFAGMMGNPSTPTPTIRNVPTALDLNAHSVKNICCVGAGYVGEFVFDTIVIFRVHLLAGDVVIGKPHREAEPPFRMHGFVIATTISIRIPI
jgi:hypothetical protein